MDKEAIIERLGKILEHYEISAAVFADKINVQRSSLSHLLNGRNKPSLDFVIKVNRTFPEVDLYWLLYGKGIFPSHLSEDKEQNGVLQKGGKDTNHFLSPDSDKLIERIVIFFDDDTFKSFKQQ
ncbi:MAG: helix-turn-helix transcriptional regulator [Maribacter sp.]